MVSPATVSHRTGRHPTAGSSHGRPASVPAPPPPTPVAAAPGRAARFRIDLRTTTWWWAPEMYELLGLPPQGVRPCADALLQCQHRDDRARTLAALTRASTGSPFALVTRVQARDGAHRLVTVVGEPHRDPDGGVTAVEGMCVDITPTRSGGDDDAVAALQLEVSQLRQAMASRATIEQAKGILMLLTGCGEQVAFDLLAHMSSHTHRKVREVAAALTDSAAGRGPLPDDIQAILRDACPPAHRTG
ncbi:PAS and ANTAR domain-containing protein [Geodermatophilus sp. SYSU D00815]